MTKITMTKILNPPYLIEVSMWDDCGQTDRWPANSEAEALVILRREEASIIRWARESLEPDLPESSYQPAIAQILIRPEADEDGDYPQTYLWEKL